MASEKNHLSLNEVLLQSGETPWQYYIRIANLVLKLDNQSDQTQELIHAGRITDPEILITYVNPADFTDKSLLVKKLEKQITMANMGRSVKKLQQEYQKIRRDKPLTVAQMTSLYSLYKAAIHELTHQGGTSEAQKALGKIKSQLGDELKQVDFLDVKRKREIYAAQTLDRVIKIISPFDNGLISNNALNSDPFLAVKSAVETFKIKYNRFKKEIASPTEGNVSKLHDKALNLLLLYENLESTVKDYLPGTNVTTLFNSLQVAVNYNQLERELNKAINNLKIDPTYYKTDDGFAFYKSKLIEQLTSVKEGAKSKKDNPYLMIRMWDNPAHAITYKKNDFVKKMSLREQTLDGYITQLSGATSLQEVAQHLGELDSVNIAQLGSGSLNRFLHGADGKSGAVEMCRSLTSSPQESSPKMKRSYKV